MSIKNWSKNVGVHCIYYKLKPSILVTVDVLLIKEEVCAIH